MNKAQIAKLVKQANDEAAKKKHVDKQAGDLTFKNIKILSQEGHDFRQSHCEVHCYKVGEWAKMGRPDWQDEWFHCEENCRYRTRSDVADDTKNEGEKTED